MKRNTALALMAAFAASSLVSCSSPPPPPTRHVHHYHNTTTTRYRTPSYNYKPAGVSGGYNSYSSSPEGFSAVSPPHSYSN